MKPLPATAPQEKSHVRNWRSKGHLAPLMRPTKFPEIPALMINQFGNAFTGSLNVLGLIAAVAALALIVYMLFKPYKEATKLSAKV